MNIKPHSAALATLVLTCSFTSLPIWGQVTPPSDEQSAIGFTNIAQDSGVSGIDYLRVPSARYEKRRENYQTGFSFPDDIYNMPLNDFGMPGVVVFDFDKDGDLDIYTTNGPGQANSLLANQFAQTGLVTFVDVAASAGVALSEFDGSGVCYGDIDNDGDHDLLVLSTGAQNTLFENNGDGTFSDITAAALPDSTGKYSTSCSMGDIDNDGLLDIAISNAYEDWSNFGPVVLLSDRPRAQANQLYRNRGRNRFNEIGDQAGINSFVWVSWSAALVDYDQDGDMDLFFADQQGAVPAAALGGEDVGYLRLYTNDGRGNFTDVTVQAGLNRWGDYMGMAFADFNADGYLDIFATNFGDFYGRALSTPLGFLSSGWFLGNADAGFDWPGVGELGATPMAWGVIAADYDNDTDTDVAFLGGFDLGTLTSATNPGALLVNDGAATFTVAQNPFADTDYLRRQVQGVAAGDLNDDGYMDIVSVASKSWPATAPLIPVPGDAYPGPFEATAFLWPQYFPNNPQDPTAGFTWVGIEQQGGQLAVEMNRTNVNNNWVKITPVGSVGLTRNARVNRDGIGAVLSFTPQNSATVIKPVMGGASHASQEELTATFGLGENDTGMVEVLWPGGVKNRLYDVAKFERITLPEIPCDFTNAQIGLNAYQRCVHIALWQLYVADVVTVPEFKRIYASAVRAYEETHL